ncbi:MAG: IS3 family transposase [Gammaproteobacteria bacterium]|nr:IS3 family transposase [Gammaproteobacteria bacterium]
MISELKETHKISRLCQNFGVSTSGYYEWLSRPKSERQQRDDELKVQIKQSFLDSHGIYGAPRIHEDLKEQGEKVAKKRVARLMKEEELVARSIKAFKKTTVTDPVRPVADNLLQQDFGASAVNQRWVTDITYIRTDEGWLYLAAIMDLYSRAIVGWAMDKQMTVDLVCKALMMGLSGRKVTSGLILHSDRGVQYTAGDYQQQLDDHGIVCSMSGTGNCYDNAAMESFFHSLKTEWVYHEKYKTRDQAKASVFEYIEIFYNRTRRHSTIGQIAPMQFEQREAA